MNLDWTLKCSLSPMILLLGRLYLGPASLSEVMGIAETLYTGNSCWTIRDIEYTIKILRNIGVINGNDDKLALDGELHPVERFLAEKAANLLKTLRLTGLNDG